MSGFAADNSGSGAPVEALPRILLKCRANANVTLDYLIAIDDCAAESEWSIALRYVPDKLVVEPAALARYVDRLAMRDHAGPEQIALTILTDINNETVPRWVEVACTDRRAPRHRVLVEDRQPNWDNPALLARLAAW